MSKAQIALSELKAWLVEMGLEYQSHQFHERAVDVYTTCGRRFTKTWGTI